MAIKVKVLKCVMLFSSHSQELTGSLTPLAQNIPADNCLKDRLLTEHAALVVTVRSEAAGARVGATAGVRVKQGSSSMLLPPTWNQMNSLLCHNINIINSRAESSNA
jgi:hypothetical protein